MPKQTKKPADPSTGPVAQFGYELRTLRQLAGKSYAAIAATSYYSKSAIWAVDQGHTLPTVNTLKAFVTECGADQQQWLARRTQIAGQLSALKTAQDKPIPRHLGVAPPDPAEASTVAEYLDALKAIREWSGMTYRQIDEITRHYPRRVVASTLCSALKRGTLPSRDLVANFLRALNLGDLTQHEWLEVWQALQDGRPVRAPTARRRRHHAGGRQHGADGLAAELPTADSALVEQPKPAYPIFEVRDWIFVDGHWQPARPELPSHMPAILRLARAELARLQLTPRGRVTSAVVLAITAAAIMLLILLLVLVAPGLVGRAANAIGLASDWIGTMTVMLSGRSGQC